MSTETLHQTITTPARIDDTYATIIIDYNGEKVRRTGLVSCAASGFAYLNVAGGTWNAHSILLGGHHSPIVRAF